MNCVGMRIACLLDIWENVKFVFHVIAVGPYFLLLSVACCVIVLFIFCCMRYADGAGNTRWVQGIVSYIGVQIPHGKGQFLGKGAPIVKYRDFLPWAVQKRLNRSICRFGCGLGWAEGSTTVQVQLYSPVGASVPSWEGTLVLPGKYNWTIRLRRRCGLMSNYFDHLL